MAGTHNLYIPSNSSWMHRFESPADLVSSSRIFGVISKSAVIQRGLSSGAPTSEKVFEKRLGRVSNRWNLSPFWIPCLLSHSILLADVPPTHVSCVRCTSSIDLRLDKPRLKSNYGWVPPSCWCRLLLMYCPLITLHEQLLWVCKTFWLQTTRLEARDNLYEVSFPLYSKGPCFTMFILYLNIGNMNHIGVRIRFFATIVRNKTAKITS